MLLASDSGLALPYNYDINFKSVHDYVLEFSPVIKAYRKGKGSAKVYS